MTVRFSHKFTKQFRKLSLSDRGKVNYAIRIFKEDPFSSILNNHKLKGKQKGFRSFSAGFDLRIIYREEGGHAIVIMIMVGSHDQVY